MPNLYIIAGCNGAGKTTASYTILPDILDCREFVNADEIARGISPFHPESAHLAAGRIMLSRIKSFIKQDVDFAFETTLATRSYVSLMQQARDQGYTIHLIFFWLRSVELAIQRVKGRVQEGGHHIPDAVVRRRYERGLFNFFNLYDPLLDKWMFIDNSDIPFLVVAEKMGAGETVWQREVWTYIKDRYGEAQ